MPETAEPIDVQPEPRETAGITTRLMLLYAQREGGREALEAVLDRAGLSDREAELLDENSWFSFDTKIRLFSALADVFDDPRITRRAGAAALEISTASGLKLALRALGSPRIVYQQIVRANAKFSARHAMELVEISSDHARLRFVDLLGRPIHRLDCEYNIGLLSCVPAIFGQRPARISHPICALRGADHCIYDVTWDGGGRPLRTGLLAGLSSAAALGATALVDPGLLPAAGAYTVAATAVAAAGVVRSRRARWRTLEAEAADQGAAAARLTESLRDLVSELRLDEVLDKIVGNASAAVNGKQFALLVAEDGRLGCRSSTGVPAASIATLEAWAAALDGHVSPEPVLVEDVASVPALSPLARATEMPLRTVCAAPLVYRGERIGVLVALAAQARSFLPRDVELVQSYALPAAIALNTAREFAEQRSLASRDPLTGLLNHREFHETIDRELDRGRQAGLPSTVVLFDLDGFKLVNDGCGHAEGDRVLRRVAEAFAAGCGDDGQVFRVGGDEFAFVLPGMTAGEAELVACRAREGLRGLDTPTGASYGLACFPDDGDAKDALLARADERLYAMKYGAAEAEDDGWRTAGRRESPAATHRRFQALIDHSSESISVIDSDGAIEYQNRAAGDMLGYRPSTMFGRSMLEWVHPEDLPTIQAHFGRTLSQPGLADPITCRLRHADGSWRWVESYTNNLLDDPAVGAIVVHSRDVSDRHDLEERLRRLAFHDALTGLANRTLLADRLAHALAARRRDGDRIAVLMLDLAGFRGINDGLGHAVGDQVLRAVAERLAAVARADDTVARLAGDEFALLLERVGDAEEALAVAHRAAAALRDPLPVAERALGIDVRLGVAVADGAIDPDDLLRHADAALYVAKEHGSEVELYRPDRDPRVGERAALAAELGAAIEARQLEVHLQPVADMRTDRVVAVEALVRWRHPERGLLSPAAFLPAAEASGHIGALTRTVLCLALDAGRRLEDAGHPLEVAVNLSAASLDDASLVDEVTAELLRRNVPVERLWFEITESTFVGDPERGGHVVGRLARMGSGLSLDDFGTGHSSLTRLRALPIRELKIDRSFVRELLVDSGSAAIVRSTINLGHDLGLRVVAEGIEDEPTWNELRRLGCDRAQGYLLCRPVPLDDLLAWLSKRALATP